MGAGSSGTSSTAYGLLPLLRPRKPAIVAILGHGQGGTWQAEKLLSGKSWPELVYCQSAAKVEALIAKAAGGTVVLDKATDLRAYLRQTWMETYLAEKALLNLREPEGIPVKAWVEVQDAMLRLYSLADAHDVDLIEIYGESPVWVALEEGGVGETEHGRRPRGSADGALGCSILISMDGGLHGRRPLGSRAATVIKDTPGMATGVEIPLPEFRGKADRAELVRRLKDKFGRVLPIAREIHRAEVKARAGVADRDDWAGARKLARSVEHERLIEVVRQMLAVAKLDGTTSAAKLARATRLEGAFGTGYLSLASLKDAPVELLRLGVEKLRDRLANGDFLIPKDMEFPSKPAEPEGGAE